MLILALCITPVAAVSADDFEIVFDRSIYSDKYTYCNVNNPDEQYTEIFTLGTFCLYSLVTFKPANIPDAPTMVVDTCCISKIKLPRSVDEWEIKYYSKYGDIPPLNDEYLKNAGVVNLNEEFKEFTEWRLYLELSWGQYIISEILPLIRWSIPSAK
jgi:hypothetical protein